jgi:hypothetical protein
MSARILAACILLAPTLLAEDVENAPRAVEVGGPAAEQGGTPAAGMVFSRTEQFRITGGESLLRGTVAMLAEQTKDELLRLTGEPDEWKVPVAIQLRGQPGEPLPPRTVAMRLWVVEGVMQLRIDIHIGRGIDQQRLQRAVTTALLYERSLGKNPAETPLSVPPWLADGLCEATAWRLNKSDRRLYEALFKSGGLFRTGDLFDVDDEEFEALDGATRAAFRISSGALVMALLEQPQGMEGFRAFLTEAAAHQGEMPLLLRRHFPELNLSETSLAKWWALQLAAKGGLNPLTDILTITQTENQLDEALHLQFRTPEGIFTRREITAWPELAGLDEPARQAAVRPAQDALVRLSYRCFPSYRPLLNEYQMILSAIASGQSGDVPQRLDSLKETRGLMISRAARGRDYLDWFEITRARETSGAFDDYQRLKERLKAKPHRRKDDLSSYLDRMEGIFHRDTPRAPWQLPAQDPWAAGDW